MSEADGVFVVCFILFSPVPSLTRLYAHISLHARIYAITTEDALAGKLTGMLLEMSTTEILLEIEEDVVASASSAPKSKSSAAAFPPPKTNWDVAHFLPA